MYDTRIFEVGSHLRTAVEQVPKGSCLETTYADGKAVCLTCGVEAPNCSELATLPCQGAERKREALLDPFDAPPEV